MLLCTATIPSFLLLSSIPFYRCTETGLFTHLDYFLFYTITDNVAMNSYVQVLVWTYTSCSLG